MHRQNVKTSNKACTCADTSRYKNVLREVLTETQGSKEECEVEKLYGRDSYRDREKLGGATGHDDTKQYNKDTVLVKDTKELSR